MNRQAYDTAQRNEAEDIVGPLYEEPETTEENTEWKRYNLLSLGLLPFPYICIFLIPRPTDGGGIRGYWSLLTLEKLMEFIAVAEEKYDDGIHHSFWPEELPENLLQVPPPTEEEKRKHAAANSPEERRRAYSNTRRFVTTEMTQSDQKAVATPYLIRSYDHNQRTSPNQSRKSTRQGTMHTSRSNTQQSGLLSVGGRENNRRFNRSINYENAQVFEVWEVARAATAAPLYFEPLKIKISRSSEYMRFTDGGFNTSNNPTREATREIEEAHGKGSMGVVVSIGTARQDKQPPDKGFQTIIPRLKGFVQSATDPEVMHREMDDKSHHDNFPYYRLNDTGSLKIKMDEWEPKRGMLTKAAAGSETIATIKRAFYTWAGKADTVSLFQDCAEELVRLRRARTSDRARWERYATCARFTCRIRTCETDEFLNSDEFRDHLSRYHSWMTQDRVKQEVRECRRQWCYQPVRGP
ncbi:MAG: hypothetical protein Q9187_003333 [Circinaria calcarea]